MHVITVSAKGASCSLVISGIADVECWMEFLQHHHVLSAYLPMLHVQRGNALAVRSAPEHGSWTTSTTGTLASSSVLCQYDISTASAATATSPAISLELSPSKSDYVSAWWVPGNNTSVEEASKVPGTNTSAGEASTPTFKCLC